MQPEGRVLQQEPELVADHAAGQCREQVVDELDVWLGGVGHTAAPSENGTTRFSGTAWPTTRTSISMRMVSRGGSCSARTVVRRTRSMRGSSRRACRTYSLIKLRVRSTFGSPMSSWCREPYVG